MIVRVIIRPEFILTPNIKKNIDAKYMFGIIEDIYNAIAPIR